MSLKRPLAQGVSSTRTLPLPETRRGRRQQDGGRRTILKHRKGTEAFNRNDAAAVAALYAEDGVWVSLKKGAFQGRQAIEKAYAKYEFGPWHPSNLAGRVDRVIAVGNDVRAYGKWTETFRGTNGGPIDDEGYFLWVNVREGGTWKIRKSSSRESNSHN
jgi:uncharacterized protein (TIGR02246 family)